MARSKKINRRPRKSSKFFDRNVRPLRVPKYLPEGFQPWAGMTLREIQRNNPEGIYWINARDWEHYQSGESGDVSQAILILAGCCSCEYCPDC